ncbi:hypothetical protein Tco_0696959 [Tanacetum coccineum]
MAEVMVEEVVDAVHIHDIMDWRWLASQTFDEIERGLRRRWIGVGGGVVSGCGVVFGVARSSLKENPGGARGVVGGESRGVEGGAT